MKIFVIIAMLFAINAQAETISGYARVIDGDTIKIDKERIRLIGIDAPEYRQRCVSKQRSWPCGYESTDYLRKLTKGKEVQCEWKKRDRYNRPLARCKVGSRNINSTMVMEGWALAFTKYESTYLPEQQEAEKYKRGMHNSRFQTPQEWRRNR